MVPSSHTFEKARPENDIFTRKISLLVKNILDVPDKKPQGPDLARGPHFAHPWFRKSLLTFTVAVTFSELR